MSQAGPQPEVRPVPERDQLRQKIEARIRSLERASGNGLWSMALFLLVSLAAFHGFSIFPDLSEETRKILGAPPPGDMISLALVIYTFSSIVRTLARMSRNIRPYMGLMHAAFYTAFYVFYHLSGILHDNFWAVFFAGLSVLGLENFYLWSHSNAAVRKEKALLESIQRGAKDDQGKS